MLKAARAVGRAELKVGIREEEWAAADAAVRAAGADLQDALEAVTTASVEVDARARRQPHRV